MNSIAAIGLSGVRAATRRLDASAHNIANAATPGFRREQVLQQALPEGGVEAEVSQSAEPGEDLAADLVDSRSATYAFLANVRSIQAGDEMLGALLDERA